MERFTITVSTREGSISSGFFHDRAEAIKAARKLYAAMIAANIQNAEIEVINDATAATVESLLT